MAVFPSLIDLLIPNLNIFTIIGIVLLIVGIVMFIPQIAVAIKSIGLQPMKIGLILILISIALIWGVSIIQDFLTSLGGQLILIGLISLGILYIVLFVRGDKK